jgi:hypothetical protein
MAIVRGYYRETGGVTRWRLKRASNRTPDWSGVRSGDRSDAGLRPRQLASDRNVAKAQNHASAGRETAKAQLRPEAGKQQHQIQLAANDIVVRSG